MSSELLNTPETSTPGHSSKDPNHGGTMLDNVSHFFSWVFSPLLTPTYGMVAVFVMTPLRFVPARTIALVLAVVFAITGVLPGITVWLLTKAGNVTDIALSRRSDRFYPYIIMIAALMGAGWYLASIGTPKWIAFFFMGAAVAAIVNLLVNYKWKISAHGAGMGGLTALFVILQTYAFPNIEVWIWVIISILVTGILSAGRVWLGRHTPMQTIAGALVGFFCVFFTELI